MAGIFSFIAPKVSFTLMERMRRYFAGLLLALSAVQVAAGSSAEKWIEVRRPHFIVLTNSNEKHARHVAIQFERMRAAFHALFPAATEDTDMPITVLAVKDKESFQALEPEDYLSKGKLDLTGYFQQSQGRCYILLRLDARGDNPYAIVYH